MKRFPPEIDELMWELAERQDETALDDFVDRYPQYKVEMTQRVKLVRGLRGARPKTADEEVRPAFVPRAAPARSMSPWLQGTLAFASVCMIAGLVLWGVIGLDRGAIELGGEVAPTPTRFSPPQPEPFQSQPQQPRMPSPADGVVAFPEIPPKDRPVTVRAEGILLHDALQAVAAAARIQVTVSPDVPNPQVVLDYNQMGATRILEDMGRNFGFLVLDDGIQGVIILPLQEQPAQAHVPGSGDLQGQPEPDR